MEIIEEFCKANGIEQYMSFSRYTINSIYKNVLSGKVEYYMDGNLIVSEYIGE